MGSFVRINKYGMFYANTIFLGAKFVNPKILSSCVKRLFFCTEPFELTDPVAMQYLSHSRRIARVLKPLALVEADVRFVFSASHVVQWPSNRSLSHSAFPGMDTCNQLYAQSPTTGLMMWRANFSSEAKHVENPTEAVKELHGKILDSVNFKRSMPPNAWLWSLIENCRNEDDVSFLFDVLQTLRRFRLSNLRIHDNFNCNLCRQVARTCVRVGAINHGKRALWKHNVHGLTPSVASAHHLLSYALEHKDAKLMDEVMKLLKTNNLPLQPGTADLVFRICYDTDNWDLLAKYSKKFCKAGVKLRKTTFDVWMEFAAKRGDTESLWNVDKLRSETYTQHTLSGAFSCAKGFLLEHKPEEAAAVIQIICQAYPDEKKSALEAEFKKLVNEWPVDVIKHQNEEDKKTLAASLKSDIPAMVNALVKSGLRVSLDLDELNKNEALLS